MNERRLDELLAGRALHALSVEDERELDAAIAADHSLRERVARDEQTAAALADATPGVAPPAYIRDELLARIADRPRQASNAAERGEPPAADPIDESTTTVSRRWPISRRAFALAASAAVVAAIGVGAIVTTQLLDRPDAVVALDEIEGADDGRTTSEALASGGTLEVHWSHEIGEVVIIAEETPELEDGSQYELWFVRDETPVSAGVFDGGADAPILLEGELAPGDVVAVTIEDAGGSPTGAPTTDPVVAIPTE